MEAACRLKTTSHCKSKCASILTATGCRDNTEEEVDMLLEKLSHIREWSGYKE